jgi:hypothetical protein
MLLRVRWLQLRRGGKKKPSLTGVFGRAAQAKAAEVLQRSTEEIEEEERDA